jgi:putative transposase
MTLGRRMFQISETCFR